MTRSAGFGPDDLAWQAVHAGLPAPVQEHRFHPTRRWRLGNLVECAHGKRGAASNRSVFPLRRGVSPESLGPGVLLSALRPKGVADTTRSVNLAIPGLGAEATAASDDSHMPDMREDVRSVPRTEVLHAELSEDGRRRASSKGARRRSRQGLGEGRSGRCCEPGLEGRPSWLSGFARPGLQGEGQATAVLRVRDHRRPLYLRLGEPDRRLCRHLGLRPHVSVLPQAVRP